MSLLEKAKSITTPSRQNITADHVELAQAFVASEIGITAVNVALGYPKTSIRGYITIARALRQDYRNIISSKGQEESINKMNKLHEEIFGKKI